MIKWLTVAGQVALLTVIAWIGGGISEWLRLPIPGSMVGMLLLFVLLRLELIRLQWVDAGAQWLLAHLLLFYIPANVGIMQYKDLIASRGVQVLGVIALSSWLVMAAAGLTAEHTGKRRGT